MLSDEVGHHLQDAFRLAREARNGPLTIEHLLLAILHAPKVLEVLRACRCDLARLEQELEAPLYRSRPSDAEEGELPPTLEVHPTPAVQRVLQRAVFHVQSSARKEVGVTDVLVAIFSEKQSRAVKLLNDQNVKRVDVVNYFSHEANPRPSMRIGSIVIHTTEFDRTIAFWQAALGYVPREPPKPDWVVLRDPTGRSPNLSFQARDHRPPSRSWVHLDLYALDQEAEVHRLLALGATRYPWRYSPESDFIVLEDPGGNLFCVVAKPDDLQ